MALHDVFDAGARNAIDTPPVIHYVERGSPFDPVAVELIEDCPDARYFVTNDAELRRVTELEVVVLADIAAGT